MNRLSIIGVIYKGVFAAKWSGSQYWSGSFKLLAYRDTKNNELIESLMTVNFLVNHEELKKMQTKLKVNLIYCFTVEVRDSQYELIDFSDENIKEIKDAELEFLMHEYRKASVYEDNTFGVLVYDKEYECYDTKYIWDLEHCDLSIECKINEINSTIHKAHKLVSSSGQWLLKAKQFAASQLLELANEWGYEEREDSEEWNDDDWNIEESGQINEVDFENKVTLLRAKIDKNGIFLLHFEAHNMFSDRGVYVFGSLDNGFYKAEVG